MYFSDLFRDVLPLFFSVATFTDHAHRKNKQCLHLFLYSQWKFPQNNKLIYTYTFSNILASKLNVIRNWTTDFPYFFLNNHSTHSCIRTMVHFFYSYRSFSKSHAYYIFLHKLTTRNILFCHSKSAMYMWCLILLHWFFFKLIDVNG